MFKKGNMVKKESKNRSEKYKKRIQIISLVSIGLVLTVATLLSIPLVKSLKTEDGMQVLEKTLEDYKGFTGVFIFLLIQSLQVVIAVVPPIQIVGGLLFGWFWGAILSFLGIVLGSLMIFSIVFKFGRPVVEAFIGEKHLKKFGFLQDDRKLTKILMILYLIPGIPKDVLSYLVPLTKIKRRDFFIYVMPCRLPSVFMSTILGSNVIDGNFKSVVAIISVSITLGIIGFILKDVILDKIKQKKSM